MSNKYIINMRSVGRYKFPVYNIVVTPSNSSVSGSFVEKVGFYNPMTENYGFIDMDRLGFWLLKGVRPGLNNSSFLISMMLFTMFDKCLLSVDSIENLINIYFYFILNLMNIIYFISEGWDSFITSFTIVLLGIYYFFSSYNWTSIYMIVNWNHFSTYINFDTNLILLTELIGHWKLSYWAYEGKWSDNKWWRSHKLSSRFFRNGFIWRSGVSWLSWGASSKLLAVIPLRDGGVEWWAGQYAEIPSSVRIDLFEPWS